jgi:hypothetical protein
MNRLNKVLSSSYSSTFHHGGGSNSSDYDASNWGVSSGDDASSDDDFCWAGNKDGFNYGVAPKDNLPPIGYVPSSCMPSLNHSQVIPISSLPLTSSAVNSLTAIRFWQEQKRLSHRIPTIEIVQKVPSTTNTTIHKHHHHSRAICHSYGVGSMDLPNPTQVTSSKGVGQGR